MEGTGIKTNVLHMRNTMTGMTYEMTYVISQINEYESIMQHVSAICNEILNIQNQLWITL